MMQVLQSYRVPEGIKVTMHHNIPQNVIKGSKLMSLAGVWEVVRVESSRTVILRGGEGRPAMNENFMLVP